MNWKGTLAADQTGHPVVWWSTLDALGYGDLIELPELGKRWFYAFWGDERDTDRLKIFGHKVAGDMTSPHFLCTRRRVKKGGGSIAYHTDPGYTRYCLQIQLCNPGGFVVRGPEDDPHLLPLFEPGLVILLDSHSPHAVVRDNRLPACGINKLLAGLDFVDRPNIAAELPKLVEHIPLLSLP